MAVSFGRFLQGLRGYLQRGRKTRRARPQRPSHHPWRPIVEVLEDRLAPAQLTATWQGLTPPGLGGPGNWSVASNWDIGVVPNNGGGNTYNVLIDGGKLLSSSV